MRRATIWIFLAAIGIAIAEAGPIGNLPAGDPVPAVSAVDRAQGVDAEPGSGLPAESRGGTRAPLAPDMAAPGSRAASRAARARRNRHGWIWQDWWVWWLRLSALGGLIGASRTRWAGAGLALAVAVWGAWTLAGTGPAVATGFVGLGIAQWARGRRRNAGMRLEMDAMRRFTISAMAAMAEAHDGETAHHARRLQLYMELLCRELTGHPRFHGFLRPAMVNLLIELTPVHDIGKVGIPDSILLKKGSLTADEYRVIQRHVEHGQRILERAYSQSGMKDPGLFRMASHIVAGHHERWDGSGYPNGLRGDTIPIPARMLAVADVYDALVSKRVYKEAMAHARALETIRAGRGSHFDPDVVDAFLAREAEWATVAATMRDEPG